jgi:aldehyde:ferredoxin oxidoreductase
MRPCSEIRREGTGDVLAFGVRHAAKEWGIMTEAGMDRLRHDYYKARGWDSSGRPPE